MQKKKKKSRNHYYIYTFTQTNLYLAKSKERAIWNHSNNTTFTGPNMGQGSMAQTVRQSVIARSH